MCRILPLAVLLTLNGIAAVLASEHPKLKEITPLLSFSIDADKVQSFVKKYKQRLIRIVINELIVNGSTACFNQMLADFLFEMHGSNVPFYVYYFLRQKSEMQTSSHFVKKLFLYLIIKNFSPYSPLHYFCYEVL